VTVSTLPWVVSHAAPPFDGFVVTVNVLFRIPSVGLHAVQSLQLATQSIAVGQAE
jgi:hypothetical protein